MSAKPNDSDLSASEDKDHLYDPDEGKSDEERAAIVSLLTPCPLTRTSWRLRD